MATIIQQRRGTAAEWTAANTILANGEKGLETDGLGTTEVKEKIGNGVLAWNDLPYQETGAVKSVNTKVGDVVLDGTEIELINGGGVSVTQAISDLSTDVDGKIATASNGLTKEGTDVKLKGQLTEDALIDGDATNSFVVVNNDQFVVNDVHGNVFVIDGSGVTVVDGVNGNNITMDSSALSLQSVGSNVISLNTTGINITDSVNGNGIYMTATNVVMADSTNNNVVLDVDGINLSSSDKVVINTSTTLNGASYGADYSVANVANPRWLTDKAYVDSSIGDLATEVDLNTAKVGITPTQASDITTNNAKVSDINHVTIDLPNVDNTSDANKPVSTAQQTALDLKVAIATNPSKTVKGAIKAFYDVATSTLEISIDGVNIP